MSGAESSPHVADRLLAAVDRHRAPVCVGLDPVADRMPGALRPPDRSSAAAVEAIRRFSAAVIDAVADHVPCVKLQSGCFERYRAVGVAALYELIAYAKDRGLQVILDVKRGDIAVTAEQYSVSAFGSGDEAGHQPDWVTVNGYLGTDGIEPFLRPGRGAFVLVSTSNPGASEVQGLRLENGSTVAEAVGRLVASIGAARIGRRGYSAAGAVVAATRPEVARSLRALMPRQLFLVPGFGAQGGSIESVLPCFDRDGSGAIVTASRSVIYAFEGEEGASWTDPVRRAAADLAERVGRAVGLR